MNFKRERYTEKANGIQVRKLNVNITNISNDVKENGQGLVIFSDVKGSIYMAKEVKEFEKEYVEGWISKQELGLELPEVVEAEPETLGEKIKDVIDNVVDTVDEIVGDTKDIVDEIKEGAENIVDSIENEIEETIEDIKEVIDTEHVEVKEVESKKTKTKKKK